MGAILTPQHTDRSRRSALNIFSCLALQTFFRLKAICLVSDSFLLKNMKGYVFYICHVKLPISRLTPDAVPPALSGQKAGALEANSSVKAGVRFLMNKKHQHGRTRVWLWICRCEHECKKQVVRRKTRTEKSERLTDGKTFSLLCFISFMFQLFVRLWTCSAASPCGCF